MRLAEKVAVIVGATSGIGAETARLFAREGASVVIAGRREQEGLAVADSIVRKGGACLFIAADATDEVSVSNLIASTVKAYGGLDILYNNAGGSTEQDNSVVEAPVEEFWRAIKLDAFGTFLGCRYAIPEMLKRGGGSIINSGSIVGIIGVRKRAAYTATKGAVLALTRQIALEFAEHNIRANAVVPGVVGTDRIRGFMEVNPAIAAMADDYPLGISDPIDVANAALYLASDESRRVTGVALPVEGGLFLQ